MLIAFLHRLVICLILATIHMSESLSLPLNRNHQMTGQEMEDSWNEHYLRVFVHDFLSVCPVHEDLLLVDADMTDTPGSGANAKNKKKKKNSAPSSSGGSSGGDGGSDGSYSPMKSALVSSSTGGSSGTKSKMSMKVQQVFLKTLVDFLAECLLTDCLLSSGNADGSSKGCNFSEWGALLFYEEVQDVTRYLDHLCLASGSLGQPENDTVDSNSVPPSQKSGVTIASNSTTDASLSSSNEAMHRLHLACKMITLDQPADIRRYAFLLDAVSIFPKGEEDVRKIMGKRVEFSRDAVKNVKLQFG